MPSPSVVRYGLQNFTFTHNVPVPYPIPKMSSIPHSSDAGDVGFNVKLTHPATDALSSVIMIATRRDGFTAAAGTVLALSLFLKLFTLQKTQTKAWD